MNVSQSYLDEIAEQPDALRKLSGRLSDADLQGIEDLRSAIERGLVTSILITGMGGSLYSAYGTWVRLSQSLPVPVMLWDSAELVQQAPALLRPKTAVIAISQSGESVELRRLTEIDEMTKYRVSITNAPDNTLARWATLRIATQVGPEQTVSTKTYTAGLAALYALETGLLGDLPRALGEIDRTATLASEVLDHSQLNISQMLELLGHDAPIMFLGRGSSLASANMAALVTAEAAKAPTQALSGGQFRHGPLELVRDGFVSVMFMGGETTQELNLKTIADIERLGGRCLVIGSQLGASISERVVHLELPQVTSGLLPVLEILPIQLLMVPMAAQRGYEAGKFLNGSKVTTVE